jgi:hypothetical protein
LTVPEPDGLQPVATPRAPNADDAMSDWASVPVLVSVSVDGVVGLKKTVWFCEDW